MEGSEFQVHFQLHSRFEAILDNKTACLKTKKKQEERRKMEYENLTFLLTDLNREIIFAQLVLEYIIVIFCLFLKFEIHPHFLDHTGLELMEICLPLVPIKL